MTICCDIDGCLADFTTSYTDLLIQVSGKDLWPKGWQTSPDFPPVWEWAQHYGYSKEVEKEAWDKHILSQGIFWQLLNPLPGAEQAIDQLNRLAMEGHDVYYISHRMGLKAKLQTERWLEAYGMYYPTVILTGDKIPVLRAIGANLFVDDKPKTVLDCAMIAVKEGWKDFHLFIKDTPYNGDACHPLIQRVSSVRDAFSNASSERDKGENASQP